MAKVILISQFPLPYTKLGSWTTMYNNYLQSNHKINYIICEQPEVQASKVSYEIVRHTIMLRIRRRIVKYHSIGFVDALEKIIAQNNDEKFVIQLVDNYKIVAWIDKLLTDKGIRAHFYIQVFYHGFSPFIGAAKYKFYETINELVLLTKESYNAHKVYYSIFPCKVSLLSNGIDVSKFKKIDAAAKQKLQVKHGINGKKVFIWCSQDRPKKGLSLLLDVWKQVFTIDKNIVLLVVGAERHINIDGVTFFGKIANSDLPEYYQMSDCYLFPTLCHEGFGLSLIEALNCGCYCIASCAGGVPEVLHYGKYGKLIENPNFASEWITAIDDYISGHDKPISIAAPLYSLQDWINNMNTIIENAKMTLS